MYYFNTCLMYIIFVRYNFKVLHCHVCNCGFTVLHTQYLGMFIIYLQTKFHIPHSTCPLVIPPKMNTALSCISVTLFDSVLWKQRCIYKSFFNMGLSRTEYYTTGDFICCHAALVSSTLWQAVPSLKKKCSVLYNHSCTLYEQVPF